MLPAWESPSPGSEASVFGRNAGSRRWLTLGVKWRRMRCAAPRTLVAEFPPQAIAGDEHAVRPGAARQILGVVPGECLRVLRSQPRAEGLARSRDAEPLRTDRSSGRFSSSLWWPIVSRLLAGHLSSNETQKASSNTRSGAVTGHPVDPSELKPEGEARELAHLGLAAGLHDLGKQPEVGVGTVPAHDDVPGDTHGERK